MHFILFPDFWKIKIVLSQFESKRNYFYKEVITVARAVICITSPFGKIKPLSDLVIFSDVKSYVPEWDTPDYLNACRKYAVENKVYLVPSRFVVNNILYLCLFSPKGEVLGIQGATHRNLYNQSEFVQYDRIEPIATPLGTVFLCVDVDIYHPQVTRIARMKGAQIIISSQFIDSYQLSRNMLTTGIWNAAQSNGVYVVGCCNCFSAVAAPCSLTPDESGYLIAPASSHSLFAKLYLNKLQRSEFGGNFPEKLDLRMYEKGGLL